MVGLAVTLLSACGLIFSGVLFTRLSLLVPRAQVWGRWVQGTLHHDLLHSIVLGPHAHDLDVF